MNILLDFVTWGICAAYTYFLYYQWKSFRTQEKKWQAENKRWEIVTAELEKALLEFKSKVLAEKVSKVSHYWDAEGAKNKLIIK